MIRQIFRPGRVYGKKAKLCTEPLPVYKLLNSARNFLFKIQNLKHKINSKSQNLVLQRFLVNFLFTKWKRVLFIMTENFDYIRMFCYVREDVIKVRRYYA